MIMLRSAKIIAFILTVALAAPLGPACAATSGCAADDEVHEVSMLQQSFALAGSGVVRAPVVAEAVAKAVADGPDVNPTRRQGKQRLPAASAQSNRTLQRTAEPAFLLEAALAAGLPWTLEDAIKHAERGKQSHLSLGQLKWPRGRAHLQTPGETPKTRFGQVQVECTTVGQVVGYNGCLGAIANVLGTTMKAFFSGKEVTLQSAYMMTSSLIIEGVTLFAPVVGMAVSIASSFISSALFPADDEDPYLVAIEEMANLVLEKATRDATNKLLAQTIAQHSAELAAITGDLEMLRELFIEDNTEADSIKFNFNLVMLHEISKLGLQIKDGTLGDIAGEEWSYKIFAIATEVAQIEEILSAQVAEHELVHKDVIVGRLQSKIFGAGGWADWYDENWPAALSYINSKFDECTMNVDPRTTNKGIYHRRRRHKEYKCWLSQGEGNCGAVLGSMDLWARFDQCERLSTSIHLCTDGEHPNGTAERACRDQCDACNGARTSCGLSHICSNCDRDVLRNQVMNSFEELGLQWRGMFVGAGGLDVYTPEQFTQYNGKEACDGTTCIGIATAHGNATFSECWEACFSTGNCTAIEYNIPGHCSTSIPHFSVPGISTDDDSGKYLHFDWDDTWMNSAQNRVASGSGWIMEVNQCRNGQVVWEGEIKVWESTMAEQTLGDSHGRRNDGYDIGQWQTGDTVYPRIGDNPTECRNHPNLAVVRGIQHSHPDQGKYFNFFWNHAWMDDQKVPAGGWSSLKVRQCRDGKEVWEGFVKVWEKMDPAQVDGDSHGRRLEGSGSGQWQYNDRLYPAGYSCNVKVCACNLVTGLGTNSLSVSDMAQWSVYTTKHHLPISYDGCRG